MCTHVQPADPTYERLAFEEAQRALDKQERLLEELRSRTGLLLAAVSLAASFLGREAFAGDVHPSLAALALAAFLASVAASVYVLLPRTDRFVFALTGPGVYEGLYAVKEDLGEVYRRLAYDLNRFWIENGDLLQRLARGFRLATGALTLEIVVLTAMVRDTLFQG